MTSDLALPAYKALERSFVEFTAIRGYEMRPGLRVTDVSSDRSTRFVGSVTAHFKPLYGRSAALSKAIGVVQDCFKTHNLSRPEVRRSSYYPAFGLHVPLIHIERAVEDLFDLLIDAFLVPAALVETHVCSSHMDLASLVGRVTARRWPARVVFDTLDPVSYVHRFGDATLDGRSVAVFLNEPGAQRKRKFVATAVIVSLAGKDMFVEITVKPLAIVEYLEGFCSEFDVFPRPIALGDRTDSSYNRVHDSLISCCLLFRSDLVPNSKTNQTRLFRKYVFALAAGLSRFDTTEIARVVTEYEESLFANRTIAADRVRRWLDVLTQGADCL